MKNLSGQMLLGWERNIFNEFFKEDSDSEKSTKTYFFTDGVEIEIGDIGMSKNGGSWVEVGLYSSDFKAGFVFKKDSDDHHVDWIVEENDPMDVDSYIKFKKWTESNPKLIRIEKEVL